LLGPAWMCSEWDEIMGRFYDAAGFRVLASGILLLAIVYFTCLTNTRRDPLRIALAWIGGIAVIPATIALAAEARDWYYRTEPMPSRLLALGWIVAIIVPLAIAALLRGKEARIYCAAAIWIVALSSVSATRSES